MTDPTDCCSPHQRLDQAIAVVQRHSFTALLTNPGTTRISDIAETASHEAINVAEALAWLQDHGRLERDGDHLVGAHGLTRRTTSHTLTIDDRTLHTWCAYDAIAIPIALGITARASTKCPTCRTTLVIDIHDGALPNQTAVVLWMPSGPCDNVIKDFCSQANLFCAPGHLATWRATMNHPPGEPLTLADIPALARRAWADIAHKT
jgi:alkylmercury lyase